MLLKAPATYKVTVVPSSVFVMQHPTLVRSMWEYGACTSSTGTVYKSSPTLLFCGEQDEGGSLIAEILLKGSDRTGHRQRAQHYELLPVTPSIVNWMDHSFAQLGIRPNTWLVVRAPAVPIRVSLNSSVTVSVRLQLMSILLSHRTTHKDGLTVAAQ